MNERKILKTFLLGCSHKFLSEDLLQALHIREDAYSGPALDSKLIQLLIEGIIETGEYTLEGIAYQTRIPFDVVFDAACGNNKQFSITPWARIVDLYIQVKPETAQMIFEKLLEIKNQKGSALTMLLNEP